MIKSVKVSRSRRLRVLAGEPVDPTRSALMSRVRDKHSKPELAVRRMAHSLGYRFRLHCHGLPGTPDLVFPRLRKAIFVHGCFWHRHKGCSRTTSPKTRSKYWADKFETNIKRDLIQQRKLRSLGWEVFVIWECQTFNLDDLSKRIAKFCSRPARQ
jgi:DNA mismatch endonuclease (patch repair protein)